MAVSTGDVRMDPERLVAVQTALRRVATLVAAGSPAEEILDAVSEEAARVVGADAGAVARYDAETATIVRGWGDFPIPNGLVVPLSADGVLARALRTGSPARIDDYSELEGETAARVRDSGLGSLVAAPVTVAARTWGAIVVGNGGTRALPPETEERLHEFAELLSLAVAGAQARVDLIASRRRLVEASDRERHRLGRNLHDGAQQRLVRATLLVRIAKSRLPADPESSAELLDTVLDELAQAREDLRELARGLHPVDLSERGLDGALRAIVARSPIPVDLSLPAQRLPQPIEVAAYYLVAEAMANVAKYAKAHRARVAVLRDGDRAIVEVADDGRGGASPERGSGLRGLSDRIEALRGRLDVESPPGGGTTVRAVLPLT